MYFLLGLFPLLLLFLNPGFDGSDDESPFPPWKGEKFMWQQVKFVKAIVSDIRFPIAFTDQFFASSTSSSILASNPQTS